jgi:hypothetical protein
MALLVVAGAMVNSYSRIMSASGGADIDGLLTLRLDADAGMRADDFLARLRNLPGVENVAIGTPATFFNTTADRRVSAAPDGTRSSPAAFLPVGSDFFASAGLAIHRGRDFSRDDERSDEPLAIVNETLARRLGQTRMRSANGYGSANKHIGSSVSPPTTTASI